jgi:hypothetical protein
MSSAVWIEADRLRLNSILTLANCAVNGTLSRFEIVALQCVDVSAERCRRRASTFLTLVTLE